MDKKAQGISINTIIIALIALTVLVVLIAIFSGAIGGWISGVNTCEGKGTCASSCDTGVVGPGYVQNPTFKCKTSTEKCCMKAPTS